MSMRPSTRGNSFRRSRSLVTLAVGLGAPSGPSFWAIAGPDTAMVSSIMTMITRRMFARNVMTIIPVLHPVPSNHSLSSFRSDLDALVIRRQPAPRAGAIAPFQDALLVDLSDDLAITREQRLGGAHLGA